MELVFRFLFFVVLVLNIAISGTFRKRARETGNVIARSEEGLLVLLLRMGLGLPLLASLLLYITYPPALAWARLSLPLWLRWVAASIALMTVPLILWVFRNIGRNISETLLTKSDHELVTSGPYRWVRHPLYAGSLMMLFSLSLVASNWFLLLYSSLGFVVFRWIVIPAEEEKLVQAFGEAYVEYRRQSGALLPKLF